MGCVKSKSVKEEDKEDLTLLTSFTHEELQKVHDDFLETSPSGLMDKEHFKLFYEKISKEKKSEQFLDHLFRTFDFNGDGTINFKELVCGISATTRGTPEEKLRWTFDVYDVNQDGSITIDEMKEIMRAIYAINGVTEAEQQLSGEEAFQGMDVNGDGRITVSEFISGVQKDKCLIKMLELVVNVNN